MFIDLDRVNDLSRYATSRGKYADLVSVIAHEIGFHVLGFLEDWRNAGDEDDAVKREDIYRSELRWTVSPAYTPRLTFKF